MSKLNELFNQPLNVVNVGLSSMAQSVKDQGGGSMAESRA